MAKINYSDGRKVEGKLNRASKEVHRVTNGKEHVYTIEKEYIDNPSAAQKAQRAIFGKTNSLVNAIMADPLQVREWELRMEAYNRSIIPFKTPEKKRFVTVRSFVYAFISEQLKQQPAAKRRKAKLPFRLPKGITLQIKAFSDLSSAELYEILKARFQVFTLEQNIRYLDEDNTDYIATHFAIRKKGLVLAYARLFPDKTKGVFCVGRMLTIERNKGYGKYIINQIVTEVLRRGGTTLRMHAQTQVVLFYERLGFHTVGDIFIEAGIPHVAMEMNLNKEA